MLAASGQTVSLGRFESMGPLPDPPPIEGAPSELDGWVARPNPHADLNTAIG
jgi:hypothetical protein